MKKIILNNKAFYIPYLLFVLIGAVIILTTEQLPLHTKFNSLVGNNLTNWFFKYETHIGDGLFLILIAIIFLFTNVKNSLFLLVSYGVAGGFTQFLKVVFFNFEMRPYFYHSFYNFPLKLVEGVQMFSQNSFPSGHSTTAFCLFVCLTILVHKPWQKIMLFTLALITGFSRIYLSQHFFEDVFAGSLVGVIGSTLIAYLFYYSTFLKKFDSLDKPIFYLFKKNNEK